MTDANFVRRYRVVVIAGALAWRLLLFNPFRARDVYDAIEGMVFGVGLGVLPFTALAALAGWIRVSWILVGAALTSLAIDAFAAFVLVDGRSSTGAVAIALVPPFALLTVVPLAALLGWIVRENSNQPR